MRTLARPAVTPIDKLRLELDEQFPHGATVARFQGRKMLTGIARITRAAYSQIVAEQPHFDALPEKYGVLDAQLAANIYLAVPPKGGELEIWTSRRCIRSPQSVPIGVPSCLRPSR